MYIIQVR